MIPTLDPKKKLLKQIDEMGAILLEHGLKSKLTDIGPAMVEFTVRSTTRSLNELIKTLYKRDNVDRILVNSWVGRTTEHRIQICLSLED